MSEFNPLGLIDRAALEHFRKKKLLPGFSHWDVWMNEHATAFTVAKMMNEDMLADVKSVIERALEAGMPFAEFQKNLKPYLMIRGWWGEQVMTDPLDGQPKPVQLGSTRRLKTIYQTNMHTAFAAGQWARVQANKKALPYLRYNGSAAAHPREGHRRYYGLILPVDHILWRYIFPPNGYGCKCTVSQLSRRQAEREGVSPEPDIRFVEVANPRTGEVVRIPPDITPTFAHNHSDRLGNVQRLFQDRHGNKAWVRLKDQTEGYLRQRGDLFANSQAIINEGAAVYERYAGVMENALARGRPYEGVMEIMRREGVALGGEAAATGSSAQTVADFVQAVSAYPQDWIAKANALGKVVVEADDRRAWHRHLTQRGLADLTAKFKTKSYQAEMGYEAFEQMFAQGIPKADDSLILMRKAKTEIIPNQIRSTVIHEFAHRLQTAMPELDELFVRLWKERTEGETVQYLHKLLPDHGFNAKEICKKDHFPNPYYGKMYGSEANPLPKEMMTMTFEALLGGQFKRYKELTEDPDLLYFGLALLVKYRPS